MLMMDVMMDTYFSSHLFKCSVAESVLKRTLKFGKMQYQKKCCYTSL